MPELPEVERARKYVHDFCVGKKVVSVTVAQDTIVYDGVTPDEFAIQLKDKTFKDTKRRGKHFWVILDEGPHPIFHLGMTGKFVVRSSTGEFLKAEMKRAIFNEKNVEVKSILNDVKIAVSSDITNNTNISISNNNNNSEHDEHELSFDDDFEKPRGDKKKKEKKTQKIKNEKKKKKRKNKKQKDDETDSDAFSDREAVIIAETEWPPKWHKLIVEFDDGTKMAFSDPRRLGRIRVRNDPETEEPIKSLGYDPILDDIDQEKFNAMVLKRKAPIKALLLDQSVFAGVGNWIADEVLYQSSIHPARPANTLTEDELVLLKKHVKDVIQTAVDVGANWRLFPPNWLFHFRWDKAKKSKKHVTGTGEAIEFVTVGGRTSAVVVTKQIPPVGYDPNKKKGKKRKKAESDSMESSEDSEPPKKKQKKSHKGDKKDKSDKKDENKKNKNKDKPKTKLKAGGKKKKNMDISVSSESSYSDY